MAYEETSSYHVINWNMGNDLTSRKNHQDCLNLEGIAGRFYCIEVGYGIQLAATAMAVNMAGNNYLNFKQFSLKRQIVHQNPTCTTVRFCKRG